MEELQRIKESLTIEQIYELVNNLAATQSLSPLGLSPILYVTICPEREVRSYTIIRILSYFLVLLAVKIDLI